MKVYFGTLGCPKNFNDTQAAEAFCLKEGLGIADGPERVDVIVVNTCGFINDAKKESIDKIFEMAEYREEAKKLVVSAMMVALGTAISWLCEMIPFLNLPFGGTITIASLLPIVLVGYLYGPAWGFGSAFVYSLLQMLIGYQTVAGLFTPSSDSYMGVTNALMILLLDYILAFTSVGLSSLFRKMKPLPALVVGSIVGLFACYVFHVISGAIFYGAWAE